MTNYENYSPTLSIDERIEGINLQILNTDCDPQRVAMLQAERAKLEESDRMFRGMFISFVEETQPEEYIGSPEIEFHSTQSRA